jgi:uncharacterized protein (DUF305 family)
MSKISLYTASSLFVIALVLGIGIGYYFTPEYKLSMYDKSSMDLGRPDKWLDLRYINAMIAHHRGAMLVAEQAQKSERPEIANLAKEILSNEPKLIDELYIFKKDWYKDTKKVIDPVVPQFGAYDKTFDLRVLNTIISHHENGILMTEDVRTKSSRSEIINNADAVEAFLKTSGEMLKDWRKSWYNA